MHNILQSVGCGEIFWNIHGEEGVHNFPPFADGFDAISLQELAKLKQSCWILCGLCLQRWSDGEIADMYAIHFFILIDLVMHDTNGESEAARFNKYCSMRESRRSEMTRSPTLHQFQKHVQQWVQVKTSLSDIKNVLSWKAFAATLYTSRDNFTLPERYWADKSGGRRSRDKIIVRLWDWIRSLKSSSVHFEWRYFIFTLNYESDSEMTVLCACSVIRGLGLYATVNLSPSSILDVAGYKVRSSIAEAHKRARFSSASIPTSRRG